MEGSRNWLDLPTEVTAIILKKIGVIDILNSAKLVCKAWYTICRDPSMWRSINLKFESGWYFSADVDTYARMEAVGLMGIHAVDMSCGQLVDIAVNYFATDDFLRHLAQSSPQLCRLQILQCHGLSDHMFKETASKFPMLEELELRSTPFSVAAVEAIGSFCPQLKIFKCNSLSNIPGQAQDDELAKIIAQAMPHLCHLQLLGAQITNTGLKAILDGCPCLETLDVRGCYLMEPKVENLRAVCSARYKKVRFPPEPIEPDEFEDGDHDCHLCYDDDLFSDQFGSDFEFPGHLDEPSDFDDMFYDDDDDDGVDYDDIFDNEDEGVEEVDNEEEGEPEEELELEEDVEMGMKEEEEVDMRVKEEEDEEEAELEEEDEIEEDK